MHPIEGVRLFQNKFHFVLAILLNVAYNTKRTNVRTLKIRSATVPGTSPESATELGHDGSADLRGDFPFPFAGHK